MLSIIAKSLKTGVLTETDPFGSARRRLDFRSSISVAAWRATNAHDRARRARSRRRRRARPEDASRCRMGRASSAESA